MALTAFCPTCTRTVYREEGEPSICPVCSAPLLDNVEPSSEPRDGAAASASPEV